MKAAFLEPARTRTNLAIVTDAHATGIDFEGRRATGVTYIAQGERHSVQAAREVILSAGAYGSPQLLMCYPARRR